MLSDLEFERALAAAIRAPSVHNTQPWRFCRDGDSVEVRADRSRALPEEDPLGRELLISCGGAVRHLFLALRAAGYDVRCEPMPDPEDRELVARLHVVGSRPPTLPESELFGALWTRHTRREPFAAAQVPNEVIDHLRRIVEAEGCQLEVLDADDTLLLSVLADHAERLLEDDPALRDEQRRWTSEARDPREGVPASRDGVRGSSVPLRRFGAPPPRTSEPPRPEHPLLMVLSTLSDGPRDWVDCGWTLSDVLLTLEHRGLAASPLTQVLELPTLRAQLRGGLGIQGDPQVVLRVGWPGQEESSRTRRRRLLHVVR